MKRIAVVGLVLTCLAAPMFVGANGRPVGDTQVFASIGAPGAPEGIYVAGGFVYVGTHATVRGNGGEGPSKIFRYDVATGAPLGEIIIDGQALSATHGILGMARDAAGRLYVLDRNPSRVLRIDPATGVQETYATIPELDPCSPVVAAPCSPTTLDEPPFPDYPAFDASGNLYISDLQAATIFRVPPGGGNAEIWFQDPVLDGIFGPNGIAIGPDGRLYFAMTVSQQPATAGLGLIYSLPLVENPTIDDLELYHSFAQPLDGPDGIAFGAGGNLYAALAGSNQLAVVTPAGVETRFPSPVDNALSPTPYDLPASITFNGEGSLLLTNQSFFAGNPDHYKVYDIWVNDTAQPLVEPAIA
jgi:sugar lactone lactonase YvrE